MKIFILYPIIIVFHLISISSLFANEYGAQKLFGTLVNYETENREVFSNLESKILKLKKESEFFLDPDCIYRKRNPEGNCPNPFPMKSHVVEQLARKFSAETKGLFNVDTPSGRDFSGLSQGYFIDQLNAQESVLINFSGDIFFSGDFEPINKLSIGEPFLVGLSYADVDLEKGWMIASGSKRLNAKVYESKNINFPHAEDFLQIVLFARSEFLGARLDAWATSLMTGGIKLLQHLEGIPEFSGDWAYFYFDSEGEPFCSTNIQCRLTDAEKKITVQWKP